MHGFKLMAKKRENELIIHPIDPFRIKYESILIYVVDSSKNQIIFPAGKMVELSLEVRGKRVCFEHKNSCWAKLKTFVLIILQI